MYFCYGDMGVALSEASALYVKYIPDVRLGKSIKEIKTGQSKLRCTIHPTRHIIRVKVYTCIVRSYALFSLVFDSMNSPFFHL